MDNFASSTSAETWDTDHNSFARGALTAKYALPAEPGTFADVDYGFGTRMPWLTTGDFGLVDYA